MKRYQKTAINLFFCSLLTPSGAYAEIKPLDEVYVNGSCYKVGFEISSFANLEGKLKSPNGWWGRSNDAEALAVLSNSNATKFTYGEDATGNNFFAWYYPGIRGSNSKLNGAGGGINYNFAFDYSTVTGKLPTCRGNDSADTDTLLPEIFPNLDFDNNAGDGDFEEIPIAIFPTTENFIRLGLNLLPRNPIATGGKSIQEYQNDLVDTIFDRAPLRQFDVIGADSSATDAEVSFTRNGLDFSEDLSLTNQYFDLGGLSAWVKGFGGSTSAFQYKETRYGDFGNWESTHAGTAVGVDYAFDSHFKVGAFGNWGNVNVTHLGLAGGGWNPQGWGGGLTATYSESNFYAQALLGASGFSGNHKRYLLTVGSYQGGTAKGTKSTTTYVGALRIGSPQQLGSVVLEPQLTGTWNHNQDHAWSESGGDVFNLKYKTFSDNFLQTLLAVKVSLPVNSGDRALFNPFIRAGWIADWDLNNADAKVTNISTRRSIGIPIVQDDEHGLLLEGGLDYTINNLGSTSFKLYAKGGIELWDNDQKDTDWRVSGGVTFTFGGAPKGSPTAEVVEEVFVEPAPEAAPVRGLW